MKLSKKSIALIFLLFLASNAITYKMTYDRTSMDSFLMLVKLDTFRLVEYDHNDTNILDISLTNMINTVLYDAGKTGETDKYKSLCKDFDKELFDTIEKYNEINEKRYPTLDKSYLPKHQETIDKGIVNMKKLCNVQD
jgi:hypothetical protein